ncbi:MAG: DUF445 family protein [Niameybacter sp.]|uniref:DUF445 domain-containing protein n=1 Tax=Niameybacter sp. TaxID=2033640 RepID=UPI002FC928DB
MTIDFLIAPLVGGMIGYITNGIAIKMLFRPLRPICIGGKPLPFTQGLIPKERNRIAKSVGAVVGSELIEPETLKETLLSQEMYTHLERALEEWFVSTKQSEKTIRTFLYELSNERNIEAAVANLKELSTKKAYNALIDLHLEKTLAERAVVELKGNLGFLATFMNESVMKGLEEKIEQMICEMLTNEAEKMIYQVVDQEGDKCLEYPLSEMALQIEAYMPKIKYALMKQYTEIIEKQLTKWLETLNISQIVEDKIKSMDLLELEKLILDIMKKELRAIVWLGALLGMIMGLVMNFF